VCRVEFLLFGKRETGTDGDGAGTMSTRGAPAIVVGLSSHWTGLVNDYLAFMRIHNNKGEGEYRNDLVSDFVHHQAIFR
jgi:hypothetical protein